MPKTNAGNMQGAVALVSGGLDSVTAMCLTAKSGAEILAITADYGQPAFEMEKASAGFFARALGCEHLVLDLGWMSGFLPETLDSGAPDDSAVWVPNRNGVLVNAAAAVAEARGCDMVVVGFNRQEAASFPDNSEAFIDAANHALDFSTAGRVQLRSPTSAMSKEEIARTLVKLGGDTSRLWSCYGRGPGHCGVCPSCRRLFPALEGAGISKDRWPQTNEH